MAVKFTTDTIKNKNSYDSTYRLLIEDLDTALEDAVSVSGKAPNYMTADLDMGGFAITNFESSGTASDTATQLTFTATDDLSSTTVQAAIEEVETDLETHEAATNPHSDTSTSVGLGNVDNTADADKPTSDAAQAALDLLAPIDSPAFTTTATVDGATVITAGNLTIGDNLTLTDNEDDTYTLSYTVVQSTDHLGYSTGYSTLYQVIAGSVTASFGTIAAGEFATVTVTLENILVDYPADIRINFSEYAASNIMYIHLTAYISADDTLTIRAFNANTNSMTLDDDLGLDVVVFQLDDSE